MPTAADHGRAAPAARRAEVGSAPISDDRADPPREAHPRIEAPDAVVAGETFALIVGLSPEPVARDAGRPARAAAEQRRAVHARRAGRRRRVRLADTPTAGGAASCRSPRPHPYPIDDVPPRGAAPGRRPRCGHGRSRRCTPSTARRSASAIRPIAVVARRRAARAGAGRGDAAADGHARSRRSRTPPDLTVRITVASRASPTAGCCGRSRRPTASTVPDEAVMHRRRQPARRFTRRLIVGVASQHRNRALVEFLTGIGRRSPTRCPDEFFDAAARRSPPRSRPAAARCCCCPQEPYVRGSSRRSTRRSTRPSPPFLARPGRRRPVGVRPAAPDAAAADGGRRRRRRGRERRVSRAPRGGSSTPRKKRQHARRSGGRRRRSTRRRRRSSSASSGKPPADVLHFAVHGTYAPTGVLEGLILVDGERLDPMVVKGCAFARAAVRVPQRVPGRQQQRGARRLLGARRGVPARRRGGGRRAAVVDRRRRRQGARAALLPARLRRGARAGRGAARRAAGLRRTRKATAPRPGSRTSTSDIPRSTLRAARRHGRRRQP